MKKLFFAAAVAAMMSSAFAATDTPIPKPLMDFPIKLGHMNKVNDFEAANGMHGWVLESQGKSTVFLTSADGKYFFVGGMFDESGKNLTQEYTDQYVLKTDYNKLAAQLETSAYFAEGAKGSAVKGTIYAFVDPNCIFCHLAWKAFLPYEKAGLQVRWVPVGFLKPDSAGKAAALLEAADPAAAMAKNELEFVRETESGGIPAIEHISDATAKKLADNATLMGQFGLSGTPGIVYKDQNGKVTVIPGMPRMSQLPGITGIPEQPEVDPDLAKFQ